MSRGARPGPAQQLLLEVALLNESRAREAWATWAVEHAESPLDEASSRLLPLLHRRLSGATALTGLPPSPALQTMKVRAATAFEQTRYRNALLFEEAATAIRVLREAWVPTCLLKGAALCLTVYDEPALRPLNDVDLLVPRADLGPAVDALRRVGWHPASPLGLAEVAEAHAAAFTNDTRGSIDIHWRSLDVAAGPEGDESLWAASRPAVFCGEPTRVPAPTDLLLHACVSGQRFGKDVACRWIVDALLILGGARDDLHWARFEREAARHLEAAAAADALEYLRTGFEAPVPADVVARLLAAPGRPLGDRRARARRQAPEERGLTQVAVLHYESYRRLADGGVLPPGPLGFARSVARSWGLPSTWLLPAHAIGRGLRRLAQLARAWWLRRDK